MTMTRYNKGTFAYEWLCIRHPGLPEGGPPSGQQCRGELRVTPARSALGFPWSHAGVVARRPTCPWRASLPATLTLCRTRGQAMLARMAPVATRPDHTSTGLTPMMLGRRHQGGPGGPPMAPEALVPPS